MFVEKNYRRAEGDVASVLFELGIIDSPDERLEPNVNIRDQLSLDSQEVMTLVEIVSSLAISSKPLNADNVSTISDLINFLFTHRDNWLHQDVPFVLQGSIIINRDIDSVFGYIRDYKRWPDILNHVSKIDPDYDDGRLQAFTMHIEELGTGQAYSVKSWRYVNKELRVIDFSQPLPPRGFECHKGGWRFQSLGEGQTRLISYHGFSLLGDADAEDAIILIRKHIHAALSTWARHGNGENNV